MAQHNNVGLKGEMAAIDFLRQNNYQILEHNWRFRRYEIDIIATDGISIIFVEVKTRSSDRWGNPEDAVSGIKIKRIVEAADFYVKDNNIDQPVRFDVISSIWNGRTFEIKHFDDAFLAPLD